MTLSLSNGLLFFRFLFFLATDDLNSVDYIAIGVSLTLAIVILVFLIVFYCLAQRRIAAGDNIKEMGQVSRFVKISCVKVTQVRIQ